MRVLVCGGRYFKQRQAVFKFLDGLEKKPTVIITGGADGADALAVDWARERKIKFEVFPAKWKLYGRGAGPIRNQQMIDEGKIDYVVAFPGNLGTYDMTSRAVRHGLDVLYWTPSNPHLKADDRLFKS